jgi:glycosyltransferase involved in cell wall biosynthesis
MYHGDLLGGFAARLVGIKSIVWGVHNTLLEPGKSKKFTILISHILAKLSWWIPKKIVTCARRAIDVHESLGYDRKKMHFIPNGYDLADFQPGLDPQDKFRASLLSDRTIPLIGTVGRFDPQKDHANLLDALAIVRDRGTAFRCVLVGTGVDSTNAQILEWIVQRGLADHVQLLGRRSDIPSIMNALDLHVLSSSAEAFPNVVCEAMACGTPCVVTDVGDAAYIVGDTGWVVPKGNPQALALAVQSACHELLHQSFKWSLRKNAARQRIVENFSIEKMVNAYKKVWTGVVR